MSFVEVWKGRTPMTFWVRIKTLFRGYAIVTVRERIAVDVETTTISGTCHYGQW